jgi:predicted translin family RNA/ssDNA-binding protein
MIPRLSLATAIVIRGLNLPQPPFQPSLLLIGKQQHREFPLSTTRHYLSHLGFPHQAQSFVATTTTRLSTSTSSTTTTCSGNIMPSPPYSYRVSETAPSSLDLSSLAAKINEAEEKRQDAYAQSRKFQVELVKARSSFESPPSQESSVSPSLDIAAMIPSLLSTIAPTTSTRAPREANLSARVEDYVRFHALAHFLETGNLLPPSACDYATDEEYLGGACMGLCQDLARYGMGRATARDVHSVSMARDLVQELLDYLLQFDFRNGNLRRQYDGTKYALKSLETILYELSVTGATTTTMTSPEEGEAKKENRLPQDELLAIRQRMEHRDELRETLIKKCRDGQKAAKQAIYALHRKDFQRASTLLKECEAIIQKELLPIVEEEPPLRYGSFAGVMEEYAEGRLFYVWLLGKVKDDDNDDHHSMATTVSSPSGILLQPEEFAGIVLEPEEYLGGLCDLTGEIGRYAVQQGTARSTEGVKRCLEANQNICLAILKMERYPHGIGKKVDQLRRSVEKLERMVYEMSLSEAAGGRLVQTDILPVEQPPEE